MCLFQMFMNKIHVFYSIRIRIHDTWVDISNLATRTGDNPRHICGTFLPSVQISHIVMCTGQKPCHQVLDIHKHDIWVSFYQENININFGLLTQELMNANIPFKIVTIIALFWSNSDLPAFCKLTHAKF